MRPVLSDKWVPDASLDRCPERPGDHRLLKPLSLAAVAIMILSSFASLALLVHDEDARGEVGDIPARSALATLNSFVISPTTAYVGQPITFIVNASAPEPATNLTFTIFYDFFLPDGTENPESPYTVNVTGNPGRIVQEHVYTAPGPYSDSTYRVRLSIDDGSGDLLNKTRFVAVYENSAPEFGPNLGSSLEAYLDNETYTASLNMSVTCWDADNDNLTLTWDFGDGTDQVVQWTGPALAGVKCTQNHTWSPDPELWYGVGDANITYYINLSLTDGFGHWVNTTTLLRIPLDHNFSPKGSISASALTVDPTDEVTIYGNASDAEGEPLTWTFVFSNSTEVIDIHVYYTGLTEPGTKVFQNTTYVFSVPDDYMVTLYLTDLALPELQTDPDFSAHNVTVGSVDISSVNNSAPIVLARITVVDCYTGQQDIVWNETTGMALVKFSIQANDYDGEVLYVTWDFGDGSEAAYNQSLGGTRVYTFVQIHEYPVPGQYNVSVVVTDGRPDHDVLRYKLLNITSYNKAPEIREFKVILSNSSYGLPGSVVQFVIVLWDLERDPLEVRWDFGDGSPVEWTNVTSFDEYGNATCYINHTYSEIGNYMMWVNFTDGIYGLTGFHQESWAANVVIDVRAPPIVREWNWWDYVSLALFGLMIASLVVWAGLGSMRRRKLDLMGLTMEEYLLRKEEIKKYEERHRGGEGLG